MSRPIMQHSSVMLFVYRWIVGVLGSPKREDEMIRCDENVKLKR